MKFRSALAANGRNRTGGSKRTTRYVILPTPSHAVHTRLDARGTATPSWIFLIRFAGAFAWLPRCFPPPCCALPSALRLRDPVVRLKCKLAVRGVSKHPLYPDFVAPQTWPVPCLIRIYGTADVLLFRSSSPEIFRRAFPFSLARFPAFEQPFSKTYRRWIKRGERERAFDYARGSAFLISRPLGHGHIPDGSSPNRHDCADFS